MLLLEHAKGNDDTQERDRKKEKKEKEKMEWWVKE
jgi:hypothetical protein